MSLIEYANTILRPCAFLNTHQSGDDILAGHLDGSGPPKQPLHDDLCCEWQHVFTIDASQIPDLGLTGMLSVYVEFNNEMVTTRFYKDSATGLACDDYAYDLLRPSEQQNYKLISEQVDPIGRSQNIEIVYQQAAKLQDVVNTGIPLYSTLRNSFPAFEDIPKSVLQSVDDDDRSRYFDHLLAHTPIHSQSGAVVVLGGWRHTLREHHADDTTGKLLFSMFRLDDEWLEAWLQTDGKIETHFQGW